MDSHVESVAQVWIEGRHEDFGQQVSAQLAGPAKRVRCGYG